MEKGVVGQKHSTVVVAAVMKQYCHCGESVSASSGANVRPPYTDTGEQSAYLLVDADDACWYAKFTAADGT